MLTISALRAQERNCRCCPLISVASWTREIHATLPSVQHWQIQLAIIDTAGLRLVAPTSMAVSNRFSSTKSVWRLCCGMRTIELHRTLTLGGSVECSRLERLRSSTFI